MADVRAEMLATTVGRARRPGRLLHGGAIASTQQAIDEAPKRFATGGQLTLTDIENRAKYEASGYVVRKPRPWRRWSPAVCLLNRPRRRQSPVAAGYSRQ